MGLKSPPPCTSKVDLAAARPVQARPDVKPRRRPVADRRVKREFIVFKSVPVKVDVVEG
jgi:hypothetical protein